VTSSRTETLVDVTMPQMGVSVAEGTVVAWRVGVGDRIEAEQTICEISTDKIDTEVPAPASGVVAEILVSVDQTVDVGVVLARVAVGNDSAEVGAAQSPPPAAGDSPEPAPSAAGDSLEPAPSERAAAGPERTHAPGRRYSPVVARIAAEHGIDLSTVSGTGRDGRVRKQDVLALVNGNGDSAGAAIQDAPLHIESPYRPDPPAAGPAAAAAAGPAAAMGPAAAVGPAAAAGSSPAASDPAVGEGDGLSRMRRQIGQHMKRSLDTAATCTTWAEVDMGRVEAARAKLGVTALAFVAQATIDALREHPALNAWLDGDRYTRHGDVNLGIAVSLGEDGLIVPVIHKAHELSVEGLAARIRDMAQRARARQLTPDDVRGGTFTITNPGQYGSIMATPIINQPQIGILDLEAVVKRPVVVTDGDGNDSIAIRPMTIIGLSWDHRALDGVLSAQFLATVKRRLEGLGSV
jgi:pyruvate/2-oxoglutarate dehydrogenase complex dihydrolipoamide acyltransferase (E2) component